MFRRLIFGAISSTIVFGGSFLGLILFADRIRGGEISGALVLLIIPISLMACGSSAVGGWCSFGLINGAAREDKHRETSRLVIVPEKGWWQSLAAAHSLALFSNLLRAKE